MGQLVKSEQVEKHGRRDGGPRVYFLKAASVERARVMASGLWRMTELGSKRLAYQRLRVCKCGCRRDRETQAQSVFKLCPKCRAKPVVVAPPRHLPAPVAPAPVAPAPAPPLPVRLAPVAVAPLPPRPVAPPIPMSRSEKVELLDEVREQFLRLSMTQFGKWLNERIAKLEVKAPVQPKLRIVGSK